MSDVGKVSDVSDLSNVGNISDIGQDFGNDNTVLGNVTAGNNVGNVSIED